MAGHSAVQYVSFKISGDEQHLQASHAAITSYELYNADGKPVTGGVFDLRLGTTDHGHLCTTCKNDKKSCQGHRGHHQLACRVLQPSLIQEVRRWLRAVCLECGALMVEPAKLAKSVARRFGDIVSAPCDGKPCPQCKAPHPKIVKDREDYFTTWLELVDPRAAGGERRRVKLYPDAIHLMLSRVSAESLALLGRPRDFHPTCLVLSTIVVPPTTIRPAVKSYGAGSSSNHDSTGLLQNLIKRSGLLPAVLPDGIRDPIRAPPVEGEVDRAIQNLQQMYYDLVLGNSSTSATQGNNGRRGLVIGSRSVRSFLRGLQRKEGRIRAHLLGKRVFGISRTTISGNMRYRIDEVGIPLNIARTLQVKETVQEYNRDRLATFFLNGRRQYPGSTQLQRRATGERHDVAGLGDTQLEIGDILYRDVIDGDVAFFNRQPTLERSSIVVHRAVVILDPSIHTFQFNVLACEFYNADFDGDQMNLWVAREPGARAEGAILSSVVNLFISTKSGGPVNGQVQDSIIGSYELTRKAAMDKYHAMRLLSACADPPRFDDTPADHLYDGRDIVSMIFRDTPIDYRGAATSSSDVYTMVGGAGISSEPVVVERGRLLRGVLDKKAIGYRSSGSLFHLVGHEYGPQRAIDVIYEYQQAALRFLIYRGFSVSTADLLPTPEAIRGIGEAVQLVLSEAAVVNERLLRGEIIPPIGSTVREHYERIMKNAQEIPEVVVMRYVLGSIRADTNGFFRMIASGAKGGNPNLINVSAVIGLTTVCGVRVSENFSFYRTLPYFPRFTLDPEAHGFVANSYIGGTKLAENIYQGMKGRFDLISKALTTASTGYFMRKGAMNNQSSIVDNFRRVTKDTRVVQFLYGEDGLDVRSLEYVHFNFVAISDAALEARARTGPGAGSPDEVAAAAAAIDRAIDALRADRDAFRRTYCRVEAANGTIGSSDRLFVAANVGRILQGVSIGREAPPYPSAAALTARIARVADLAERLPYTLINEVQERLRSAIPPHIAAASAYLAMLVRGELTPLALTRIDDAQLSYIIDAVRLRYSLSLIDYGSVVGILAAQAISEPLTQYMLNSHHRSVNGGTNKDSLNRIAEIYSSHVGPLSFEPSASDEMLLPLRAGITAEVANEIANDTEQISLRRFVSQYDILLEPYGALVHPEFLADAAWVTEFERAHPLSRPASNLTNWCVRFVIDKTELIYKNVDLELIVCGLRRRHPHAFIVHSLELAPEVVVRVWARTGFKRDESEAGAFEFARDLLTTPLRGISSVLHASVDSVTVSEVAPDGALVRNDRHAIKTRGSNLFEAFLTHAIDPSRAITSNLSETYAMFGIEAARDKIVRATRSLLDSDTPNLRHLYLYADEMTRTGRITSVERAGLAMREHSNVLLRMAYGDPIKVVTDAALSDTRSHVYGTSAQQMLGATPQVGSLYNGFSVDVDFVQKNTRSIDAILDAL